jgi:hypothetical protein
MLPVSFASVVDADLHQHANPAIVLHLHDGAALCWCCAMFFLSYHAALVICL